MGYSLRGHKELDTVEQLHFHFMMAQTVKNLQCRRCRFDPWLEKEMATYSSILEGLHGQRSLVGYSPWGSNLNKQFPIKSV